MRPIRVAALAVLAGLLVPSVAFACMWDYDTIKMERTRFPGTLELITGKFLRHSSEFYQWRITNRLKRLETDPTNAALLDDLAAAYDKTGQHDKAIETALKTEKLHPGRYETAANLGTFYFHSGKLEEGIPHIDRALKINPNAHFGREKYQKLLVEYVLRHRQGGPLKLPLANVEVYPETVRESPSLHYVKVKNTFEECLRPAGSDGPLTPEEAAHAIKGILGMMKFGKHDSPVLLEALGSLLTQGYENPTADAKLLAARAYLKASYEVPEGPARNTYREMAANAIQMQSPRGKLEAISLESVEADFQKELEEGRTWYAELHERELSWIREGQDPEAEFDKLYDAEPEVSGMNLKDPPTPNEVLRVLFIVGRIVLVLAAVGFPLAIRLIVERIPKKSIRRS